MNPFSDLSGLRYCSPLNSFTLLHRGISYPVNPTLLSIASPKISRLLAANPLFSTYELPPITGPIRHFISLLFGESIEINFVNCRFFAYLARDLEISSLEQTALAIVNESNTFPRVCDFANELLSLGLSADTEISGLAQGYKTLSADGPRNWPPNVLRSLLLSEFLEPGNYSELVRDVVLPLIAQDIRNADLVECVQFERLDGETIKTVLAHPSVDVNRVRATAIRILRGN
jgi:hypothetical protein